MIVYGTHNKRHDVLCNVSAAELLDLAQKECGDEDITLELCVDKQSDQWVAVKDPLLLKKGDKLRIKKVCCSHRNIFSEQSLECLS